MIDQILLNLSFASPRAKPKMENRQEENKQNKTSTHTNASLQHNGWDATLQIPITTCMLETLYNSIHHAMHVCQYLRCFRFTKQPGSNAQDKIRLDSNPHRISVIFSLKILGTLSIKTHAIWKLCTWNQIYIAYKYFYNEAHFLQIDLMKELKCHERGKSMHRIKFPS